MDLTRKSCVPCREGAPVLEGEELNRFLTLVSSGWKLTDSGRKLKCDFKFGNFRTALDFVNRVGEIAEAEGHHPDISIYSYNHVRLILYTYKIGGLHENDFILAAKIDALTGEFTDQPLR
ncbi:hypothetical protein A2Z33_06460 [Candidatus Gottesmanbacteria bacterium RBG_16_52_11]|uniref:Putative pterin-4-alpha-carbinolamine dehydratase n=1 Tax=Candidatus Gottesmanbacteria bacterium RBG_16_52_11 TaxID=1798374 RepID=A0A1F5YYE0_9BACT|nr:MAG: hypothetical protein A2Z33_06460 [Candidatus Gottesmanbacteria bacterium RBG_16_52_11]